MLKKTNQNKTWTNPILALGLHDAVWVYHLKVYLTLLFCMLQFRTHLLLSIYQSKSEYHTIIPKYWLHYTHYIAYTVGNSATKTKYKKGKIKILETLDLDTPCPLVKCNLTWLKNSNCLYFQIVWLVGYFG